MVTEIKSLSNEQASKFDKEYVSGARLDTFRRLILERFERHQEFHVIDIVCFEKVFLVFVPQVGPPLSQVHNVEVLSAWLLQTRLR